MADLGIYFIPYYDEPPPPQKKKKKKKMEVKTVLF